MTSVELPESVANDLGRCPHIRLCSSEPDRVDDVREMLEASNYQTSIGSFCTEDFSSEEIGDVDLVVVDGPTEEEAKVLDFCRDLRRNLGQKFVPLIFVTDDSGPILRAFTSRIGTDGHVLRPVDPVVLLSQVQALLRIKFLQDQIVEQSHELEIANQKLRLTYQRIDGELRLASRIQQSMLPRELAPLPPVRFAVKFAVSGKVSGDMYDLVELDDRTIGFYVADVMGHGVPAGLLTIFVKKGVQMIDASGGGRRILSPGEVLTRLNGDLVRQDLSENPFITMTCFTLDRTSLQLRFSRGGHPYPLLLRSGAPAEELKADGGLLGIFETDFPTEDRSLQPGDKLVIFTDGIDSVEFQGQRQGLASFQACVEANRHLSAKDMVERIYADLFPSQRHDDDFTLMVLEVDH